ncbi:MAG TPA: hypothetical protein VIJ34_06860, partial [Acidimicrobiales bacterium]
IGIIAIGTFALGTSSCSSSPSAAAKSLCSSVGQVLLAPSNAAVAISTRVVVDGEASGDADLDAAATALSKALSPAAVAAANAKIRISCTRLGIWQTYHG